MELCGRITFAGAQSDTMRQGSGWKVAESAKTRRQERPTKRRAGPTRRCRSQFGGFFLAEVVVEQSPETRRYVLLVVPNPFGHVVGEVVMISTLVLWSASSLEQVPSTG